jgi:hypothetical protein
MTPRYDRTRKFAEPHAMLTVDALFVVLWLSGFASQAAYNSSGLCGEGCGISKAVVGLGVFITYVFNRLPWKKTSGLKADVANRSLFFCGSTFLSIYTLKYYQFNGTLPGYDKQRIKNDNIDPDKAAFSMAPHDEEAYAHVPGDDRHDGPGHDDHDDGYGGRTEYEDDPNRYGSLPARGDNAVFDTETEYRRHSPDAHTGGGNRYAPPTAQDYDEDERIPVQFPAANYDRVTR